MTVETWILAVLGIGVGFIGWIALTVYNMKIEGVSAFTRIDGNIEEVKKDINEFKSILTVLVDERRIIDKHNIEISDLKNKTDLQGRGIKGIERFLSKKHGTEFLDSYEKTQNSIG